MACNSQSYYDKNWPTLRPTVLKVLTQGTYATNAFVRHFKINLFRVW